MSKQNVSETVAGKYIFRLGVSSYGYTGGENTMSFSIYHNGTGFNLILTRPDSNINGIIVLTASRTFSLATSDTVYAAFTVGGNSTKNVSISSGVSQTWFQGEMLSCA